MLESINLKKNDVENEKPNVPFQQRSIESIEAENKRLSEQIEKLNARLAMFERYIQIDSESNSVCISSGDFKLLVEEKISLSASRIELN